MREANEALIVVDVQNDFVGSFAPLGVPNAEEIIPIINELSAKFKNVILTQDWHPDNHGSFASNHEGKNPFTDTVMLDGQEQALWPDHCVQGTKGADFHPELNTSNSRMIIRKGLNPRLDSYSAFLENDGETETGMIGYLKSIGVDTVYIVGLATDYCSGSSAVDSARAGFTTYFVDDANRGISEENCDAQREIMRSVGVQLIQSSEL